MVMIGWVSVCREDTTSFSVPNMEEEALLSECRLEVAVRWLRSITGDDEMMVL
jgi:hypothetical protein